MKFAHFIAGCGLVILALMLAGCLSGDGHSTSRNDTARDSVRTLPRTDAAEPSPGTPVNRPGSPVPANGTVVISSTLFSGNYSYTVYQSVAHFHNKSAVITARTDRSPAEFNGTPAIRYLGTAMIGENRSISDIYVDQPLTTVLGGRTINVENGKEVSNRSIYPANYNLFFEYLFEKDHELTSAGREDVVVPAGTFHAGRYTRLFHDMNYTYWAAPEIPVPVRYSGGVDSEGEIPVWDLVSWG